MKIPCTILHCGSFFSNHQRIYQPCEPLLHIRGLLWIVLNMLWTFSILPSAASLTFELLSQQAQMGASGWTLFCQESDRNRRLTGAVVVVVVVVKQKQLLIDTQPCSPEGQRVSIQSRSSGLASPTSSFSLRHCKRNYCTLLFKRTS